MAVVGLLLPLLLVVAVILVLRRANRGVTGSPADAHAVRRFFQYLLLYGLLVVVGLGLAGLLGRLLEPDAALDDAELARYLAFAVVGVPLLAGLALWSRRRMAEDPAEARSLGWVFYSTLASLTSLVLALAGLESVLRWLTGLEGYDGRGLASFLVWVTAWGAHWWVEARTTRTEHALLHHLLGSLIGLAVAALGLGLLLEESFRVLLGLDHGLVLVSGGDPVVRGLVTLAVGAPVWLLYWARTAARHERAPLWLAYVLLAGVGGGLVTAVVAGSTLLHSVLVWLVGDPRAAEAAVHFRGAPAAAAAAVVGVVAWWYHHAVLEAAGERARTEVRRVYEYLMAGIGLVAAAVGVTLLLMALVEGVTGTAAADDAAVNTLLAAGTLLVVGGPVWWLHWRLARRAARDDPAAELASPTRRIYLVLLFGVGGVAAVVALLVGVFVLFEDLVEGSLGEGTVRGMRTPVGVLLTTAAVAGYHASVFRADRERTPEPETRPGPREVLLVGPADPQVARQLAGLTRGRVQAWVRTDADLPPWSLDDLRTALAGTTAEEVVVIAEADGLRVLPVRRG